TRSGARIGSSTKTTIQRMTMATVNPTLKLSGLAGRLVRDGLISEDDAQAALDESRKADLPLVSYLVQNRLLNASAIAHAAAEEFGLPLLDLDAMEPDPGVVQLVKEKLVRKHHVLPLFKRGKRLFVALADPANTEALAEIKFATGLAIDPILVEEDKLTRAIEKALDSPGTAIADLDLDEDLENLSISGGDDEDRAPAMGDEADDAPVVRFINKILLDAINKGASDIHFEPYE